MLRVVALSHRVVREYLTAGDMAVDATAGNGHDTLLLAQVTGPQGMVFAFDIQSGAIAATRQLLERSHIAPESYQLIQRGHEHMLEAIPRAWHGRAGAVVFNLGYLPSGDKSIITRPDTTLAGLRAAVTLLRPGGVVVGVVYTGHHGGPEEAAVVRRFAADLPPNSFHTAEYLALAASNSAPFVVVVRKPAEVDDG